MRPILNRGAGVSLRQVLPQGRFLGGSDIRVRACCTDPSQVEPGDLFVALLGDQEDGHDRVNEAVARGASAVVAERLLPVSVPTCLVRDSRLALGSICQHLAGEPASQLDCIGVGGTYGKTATTLLIRSMLKAAGQQVGTTNTVACGDGLETVAASQTTPSAPEMANWLARMVANGCQQAVLEVSSQALARHQLAGVPLAAAVLTNIRRGNLVGHGSLGNYRRAQQRLFDHLRPGGFAVMNADDPVSQQVARQLECPLITVGLHEPAEVTATLIERMPGEQTFLIHAGSETIPVRTRLAGDQQIYSCLEATALGLVLGIDLATIVRGLERLERVPGHLEPIQCGQSFGVYVDCAHTPDALAQSLRTVRQVTSGRVLCVFGAKGGDDAADRPLLGRVVERTADREVITSDHAEFEPPLQIAHDILDGYRRPGRPHILPNREAAIGWALSQARPGDSVLIAGKGTERFPVADDDCLTTSDGDAARAWLRQQASQMERPCTIRF
ncbi:MAG: UDP-N-acetylmuramoyl-L-alanyl-D-glutamate--2,6-diaminopimelate ligase [Pirellulaceae bacterium]|nr:UDP-N-acetylmuramoyl-L-alanyl-D-glutamate--2,6-diaminopimelate ligase [Pirellulaceae bacterium]